MRAAAVSVSNAPDGTPARRRGPLALFSQDPADAGAQVLVAGLFLALAFRIGAEFLQTGHLTGLLMLTSEFLVVVLTLMRRAPVAVDRSWAARIATGLSMAGPPLVRPASGVPLAGDAYTAAVSACGLVIVVFGKLSLGRSFGLMPANRGVVCSGLYRVVRHPIYAGYLVSHAAFLAAHPTLWNAVVLIGGDIALIARAFYEERTLGGDPTYARYCGRVRWRLLPGVF